MSRFDSVTIRPGQRQDDTTPGRRVVIRLKSTADLINRLEPDKVYCPTMGGYIGINIRHRDADGQIKEVLMRRWTGSAWRTFRPSFLTGGPDLAQFLSEAVPDTGKLDDIYHVLQPDIVPQEYGHIFIDFTQSPIRVFSHNYYTQWGYPYASGMSSAWLMELSDLYTWLNQDIDNLGDFEYCDDGRADYKPWKVKERLPIGKRKRSYRQFYLYRIDKQDVYDFLKQYADLFENPERTEQSLRDKDEAVIDRWRKLYDVWRPISLFRVPISEKIAIVDAGAEKPTLEMIKRWMTDNGWTSPINQEAWDEYAREQAEFAEEAAESKRI